MALLQNIWWYLVLIGVMILVSVSTGACV